jgi:hypothetical protein
VSGIAVDYCRIVARGKETSPTPCFSGGVANTGFKKPSEQQVSRGEVRISWDRY